MPLQGGAVGSICICTWVGLLGAHAGNWIVMTELELLLSPSFLDVHTQLEILFVVVNKSN